MDQAELDARYLAARVGGQAELLDVKTRRLHAELVRPLAGQGGRLSYEMDTQLEYGREHDKFFAEAQYSLKAYQVSVEEHGDRELFLELSFDLFAVYDLPIPDAEDFDEEELQAFTRTTAQFALYPFAREIINDLTGRLGVPPLTLGTLRLALSRDELESSKGKDAIS